MGRTLHAGEAPAKSADTSDSANHPPVTMFVETILEDGIDAIRSPGGIEYVREVKTVAMDPDIHAIRAPGGRVFLPKP